jgi:hypothetical protein
MIWKSIRDYFNLRTSTQTVHPFARRNFSYVLQYLFLVLGIVAQPFLDKFKLSGQWDYTSSYLISRTVFGCIVGLAVFPAVYRRSWDQSHPVFIQLCTIFSAGLGWQSLLAAGVDARFGH